jgi:hypothetical protein
MVQRAAVASVKAGWYRRALPEARDRRGARVDGATPCPYRAFTTTLVDLGTYAAGDITVKATSVSLADGSLALHWRDGRDRTHDAT